MAGMIRNVKTVQMCLSIGVNGYIIQRVNWVIIIISSSIIIVIIIINIINTDTAWVSTSKITAVLPDTLTNKKNLLPV